MRRRVVALCAVGALPPQQRPAVLNHHALEPEADPQQRLAGLPRPPVKVVVGGGVVV